MKFCDWVEINEAPKKAKISVVAHTDIDRWLKSVDGFAKDLQALKAAKEKSQAKLDQIKKKYKPEPSEKDKSLEKDQKPVGKNQEKPLDQNSDDREAVPAVEPTEKEVKQLKPKESPDEPVVRKQGVRKPVQSKSVKPVKEQP